MAILNVVQPDEFAPSSFTTVGGKLKVAISVDDGNILEYKEDGLYAKASGSGTVPGRFTYQVDEKGEVIHKGIKFSLLNIDGAISGEISGVDINDITVDDVIYHVSDRTSSGPYSDDSKLILSLQWGVEYLQRFIIRLMRSGVAEMWVVRVATPDSVVSLNGYQGLIVTIDEMVTMGELSSNPEELEPQPVDGDITIMGYSNTVRGDRIAIIGMQDNRIGIAKVEGGDGSVSIANTRFGTLAVNYNDSTNQNIKAYMGYCPLLGYLLYHNGKDYNLMVEGYTPVATDLPNPNFNTGTVGVGFGLSEEGETLYIYSMDAQSFSYQQIIGTSPLEFSSVTTIDAPTEGIIKDYLVSGVKAAYLLIKNGMYVLHITDLSNSDVTEYPLIPYNEEDLQVKLINGSLGSVFVYIDKAQAQVLVGVIATLDMSTFTLNMTQMEPIVLDGPLLFIDPLSHVSFQLDQTFSSYGMFLSPVDMSIVRVGSSLMAGGVEVAKAPIPANYLSLLMSGKMSIPFTGGQTTIAYDASPDGHTISFEELEVGAAGGGMYQSSALFKFDNGLAVLAHTPAGDISIVKVNEDNTTDTTTYQLPTEHSNTVNGFMEVAPALGVAVWRTRADKIVFARFSETSSDVYITELGNARYPTSWIMIDKDSAGNYFVKEMQTNNGLELRVWCIAPDDTVTVYDHPDVNIDGSFLVGSDILGDKLIVFGNTNYDSHIRVLDARTGAELTQGNFAFNGNFLDLKLQRIDHETLLIVENIFAVGDMPASIKVTLLKITATEVTVIKKSTLALDTWESLDGRSLTNNTYTEDGVSISYQSAIRDTKRYYVKIAASQTDFTVYEQEINQEILDKAGSLIFGETYPMPSVTLFNGQTGYIQHDLKLTSLNTFPLVMVEHDNTPRATALNATWNDEYAAIEIDGRLSYTDNDTLTYAHLEVETPSGQVHVAKYSIGTNTNGEVKRNLWVIAEPGEYIFRLRHWDGGETLEARATVPADGKDFRAPIVTPNGDGEWLFSTENTEAGERGVYNVYRSRHPVSIIEDFDRDGYVYDNIHTTLKKYSIPAEERNGVWYIIVGHSGVSSGSIWTPTFFTYGG